MGIKVSGEELVHCVIVDGDAVTTRCALVNALRMGAQNSRLVMIGADDVIASTLQPMAISLNEVERAPAGTEIPEGSNVVSYKASTFSQ